MKGETTAKLGQCHNKRALAPPPGEPCGARGRAGGHISLWMITAHEPLTVVVVVSQGGWGAAGVVNNHITVIDLAGFSVGEHGWWAGKLGPLLQMIQVLPRQAPLAARLN